ncbi:MAG TPA: hypothetical protein VFX70_14875, partial [Mycobacteriales bacterium]|nr:hypothetical protein [Mycobacteriales bacterium]
MVRALSLPRRSAPPVRPLLVADGLLVTADAAWAWFVVPTAATDWLTEPDLDAGTDQAASDLSRLFDPGGEVHLKILWGRLSAADYAAGIRRASPRTAGDIDTWTGLAATRVESLALPQRHVLLGTRIAWRNIGAGWRRAARATEHAFGVSGVGVSRREAAGYADRVGTLARRLSRSVFHAHRAPAELIAWSLSRELARTRAWAPTGGWITGAPLTRSVSGRMVPHADHVQVATGGPAAFVA